jgi:uncharacterized protein (TIGR03435 family)
MQSADDSTWLRQYAENHSDEAFAALVTRHINLVYSVALRHVGNPHHAEEITQAVFIILAKKARELRHDKALSSWLFQATCLTANNFVRSETRRHRREQEAHMQTILNESGNEIWPRIAPLLDTAVAALNEKDRRAIMLRFYEGRNLSEVGVALGASEDAAKKRVTRALEKLQRFFLKRGVTSTTATLAGAISANSVQAAPVALAKAVTAVVIAKSATVSGSTLTLIKGALKIMAWSKAKTAIVVGVGILLAAGTTTVTVKEIVACRDENLWRVPNFKRNVMDKVTPQVEILPTKFHDDQRNGEFASGGRKIGIAFPVNLIVCFAYDWLPGRIIFTSGDPQKRYDYIANLPQGSMEALQRELKNKLGLVGRPETRDMDVLLLKVEIPNAPGLKPPLRTGGESDGMGHFHFDNQPLATSHVSSLAVASGLEAYFGMPVVDQTGLTQKFNIDLTWNELGKQDPDHDALKQALLDQLGLELVPSHQPVEMLVVEKAP